MDSEFIQAKYDNPESSVSDILRLVMYVRALYLERVGIVKVE